MARSLKQNPFLSPTGLLKRQTSQTDVADVSDLFTHFSRSETGPDVTRFDPKVSKGANPSKRRTAPPVGSLSPDRVALENLNDTSLLDLSQEQPRSQIDPFYRHAEEEIISSPVCVTIFGFPQEALLSVLEDFSNIGKIVRYERDSGNWVHVQFTNHIQAKRAKEKHGEVVGGYMVGVVDCFNRDLTLRAIETTASYLTDCSREETIPIRDNSLNSSDQSRYSGIRNCSILSPDVERRKIIRPPTGPVVGTPTKNTGLLHRTMGYIFNW